MPANAALYLPAEKIDLRKLFPGSQSDMGWMRPATWFDVPLNGDTVRFNVMPPKSVPGHLGGFLNYIAALPDEEERKQDISSALQMTKTVLGLVAAREFTDNHAIWQSVFQIADAFDGYVFVHDSVLLPNGSVVVGPLRDDGNDNEASR